VTTRGQPSRLGSGQARVYVYALLERRVPIAPMRGHRLETMNVAGVYAVVERLDEVPAMTEQTLREQYAMVVRLAKSAPAILPARFGSLVDRDELARVIALRRAVLRRAFARVRGKQQMTVRVFGPAEPRASRQSSTGTDYLLSRAAARPRLPVIARTISAAVRPLVDGEHIDAGRGGIRVTLNHLVQRGRVTRYRLLVQAAIAETDPQATVVTSGPWPPFAFAPDLWPLLTDEDDQHPS
jgi:Gas vesicle synthesis protein GvpL/GvpF